MGVGLAVATAAAGALAAGASVYSSEKQASAMKSAMPGKDAYGKKIKMPDYVNNVDLPEYDPTMGGRDYLSMLPFLESISRRVTNSAQRNRDMVSGGLSTQVLRQSGTDIDAMLSGRVPPDVKDAILRAVAEKTGGAFSQNLANPTVTEADFGRNIGKTYYDIMKEGVTMAPQWESLVDAFTYKPQDAFGDTLQLLRSRNSYDLSQAGLQMQLDENQYASDVNKAKAAAQADPAALGMARDSMSMSLIDAQRQQTMNEALLGAVRMGLSGYQAYANRSPRFGAGSPTAAQTSGTPQLSKFYTS